MSSPTITQDTTRDAFVAQFQPVNGQEGVLPEAMQAQAKAALGELGIPTRKWEHWKYTNLKPLVNRSFTQTAAASLDSVDEYLIPGFDADRIVFVNGVFNEALSDLRANDGKVRVSPLSQLDAAGQEALATQAGKLMSAESDIFAALNAAYASEGVLIHLPKNTQLARPVHILHVTNHVGEATLATQHRHVFVVEAGSEAKVVESFHSQQAGPVLQNGVTEVFVEANAGVELVKLQIASDQTNLIDRTSVYQERDSRFSVYTVSFSGEIVRNDLHIQMRGKNGEANLMGLYLLSGSQHVDNRTLVDHAVPNCYSNELYKGILQDQANAAFSGLIHVHPHAQQTNAFQSNRNILLSENANVYTKPQLEIYADDVKCSHGATTGRMDEEALFYFQARGIPKDKARRMLINAFAMEVASKLSLEPVRDWLAERIENRF
jgi:Fe-S cluster assembly protein SufD